MAAEAAAPTKEDWVAIQKKTFTKWVNNHLRKKGFEGVTEVQSEFESGIKLMELVHALYNIAIPKCNKTPKLRPQKLDNISLALKMVDDAKIKTNFLKPNHLADHDLKMILGMIWAIILDYAIKGINVDELTAKEGLLLWVQKKTKGYAGVDPPGVGNFTGAWKSGLAFAALIHRHQPAMIDYASLDVKDNKKNLELAFAAAEKCGIPRLLDVEDLAAPDERSVMTYVSEFFHRFAQQDHKEVAARRAANFVKFARAIQERKNAYEARVAALLAWVASKEAEFKDSKFGETLDDAKSASDRLKAYFVTEKPPKQAEKLDIETLFAEIQTELKLNDRSPYVPDAKVSPDALDAAWDGLTGSEKGHSKAVRDNRLRFVRKEEAGKVSQEKLDEFKASFAHFDHNKDDSLDRVEFKAAAAAVSVRFKDDAAFQKTFNEVSEGKAGISCQQYTRYMTALAEDRDSPEQLAEAFKSLANDSDTISAADLSVPPLSAEDAQFLIASMPDKGNGRLDYGAFIAANFTK